MDRNKMTKLLALTASDNDGEALNAIRAANRILKKEKLSWEKFLDVAGSKQKSQDAHGFYRPPWGPQHGVNFTKVSVEEMLNVCLDKVTSDSGWAFIKSLQDQFRERNLTFKQILALEKFYKNCMRE